MTFKAGSNAPLGNYTITIKGSGGDVTSSITVRVTITQ
jgi:uncharacterized membrane protein